MQALDLSFSAPHVTPEWCAARLAEGYRLLVVDLWTGNQTVPGAEHALATWRSAGGIAAAYFVVHDAAPLGVHYGRAVAAAGAEWPHLAFVAVDVEVEPTTPGTVREACALVERDGQRPIVYTGKGFWQGKMGNPTSCAHLPLWDASYGIPPALNVPGYGGWQRRTGHQYRGTTHLDGIDVDLNVFDAAWVAPVAKSGATVPSREQDWQTVIDVTRGFGRELLEAEATLTLGQLRERLPEAGKQLTDVAGILERLRAGE